VIPKQNMIFFGLLVSSLAFAKESSVTLGVSGYIRPALVNQTSESNTFVPISQNSSSFAQESNKAQQIQLLKSIELSRGNVTTVLEIAPRKLLFTY
jgi:hypothetical protein